MTATRIAVINRIGWRWGFVLASALACSARAQVTPQRPTPVLPPAPPSFPGATVEPAPAPPVVRPAVVVPQPFRPIPQPLGLTNQTTVSKPIVRVVSGPPRVEMGTNVLVFDDEMKHETLKPGEYLAVMTFRFTNITTTNVTISAVRTSCGCTVPKLPAMPWTVAPGSSNAIEFHMDLRGKRGTLTKIATVESSSGVKSLALKGTIPDAPALAAGGAGGADSMGDRVRNLQIAAADRQAVFRGDCAKCHFEPAVGKMGESLYGAACGVCHEAEHRAAMVPDLRALKQSTDANYWKSWIINGKPGTLMPAFAQAHGGPLTDAQVESLTAFLDSPQFVKRQDTAAATPSGTDSTPAAAPAATAVR